MTPFDEANFVLLFAVVLFDFDAIFDESFIVDLEALLVLFFWETILDVFEADFIEFLAKTGLDVFEAVLVLFLDDDKQVKKFLSPTKVEIINCIQ